MPPRYFEHSIDLVNVQTTRAVARLKQRLEEHPVRRFFVERAEFGPNRY